jgi:hypothetical protein
MTLEETLDVIRELLEPGKFIVFDGDSFEIETMQKDSLGYCTFLLHSTIKIE